MRVSRIHTDQGLEPGRRAELAGATAAYVARVLRLQAGALLTLFNGRGGEYAAQLVDTKKDRVTCEVLEFIPVEREASIPIQLLQGVARSDRMDAIVQKGTELGIARLTPVSTGRSVVKVPAAAAERKRLHWQGVAIAACEQSGRNRLPEIDLPLDVAAACRTAQVLPAKILLDPLADTPLVEFCATARGAGGFALLIGPEGGLTEEERAIAALSGFERCRLGPRVLRTETASLAALAVLHAIAGDFRRMET